MKAMEYQGFHGIDLRNLSQASDPKTFRKARNLDLTFNGAVKTRGQLRKLCTVDPRSFGLYVANDTLRVAMPYIGGGSTPPFGPPVPRPPPGIVYDLLCMSTGQFNYPYTIKALAAVVAFNNAPYIAIELEGAPLVVYQHHYIDRLPQPLTIQSSGGNQITFSSVLPAEFLNPGWTIWVDSVVPAPFDAVVTAVLPDQQTVTLGNPVPAGIPFGTGVRGIYPFKTDVGGQPFAPGPAVTAHAERVWAGDRLSKDVYYSDLDSATEWVAGDAGRIRTSLHIDGGQEIRGLAVFKSDLVVVYERATQVWFVTSFDPNTFAMKDNVGGAGTKFQKSLANVMGDLFYFSEGGIRSLSAVVTTGQLREGDIGAPIQPETANLDVTGRPPLGVWSPARGQYLCAVGDTVYVFTLSPASGFAGWTTYSLPFEVTAMVEFRGQVYVREKDSGNIYVFDDAFTNEVGFDWELQFPFIDLSRGDTANDAWKFVKFIELLQEGSCKLEAAMDADDDTDVVQILEASGSTIGRGKQPVLIQADQFAPRFYGTLPWRLGSVVYRYDEGNFV